MGILNLLFGGRNRSTDNTGYYQDTVTYSGFSAPARKYYEGMENIEAMWSVMYNLNAYTGEKAAIFEKRCNENIDDLHAMLDYDRRMGSDYSVPPNVPAYKRLAMLYEKQERFDDAINICVTAIKEGATNDGNKGKMYGRLARMIKKSGMEVSPEILQLMNR